MIVRKINDIFVREIVWNVMPGLLPDKEKYRLKRGISMNYSSFNHIYYYHREAGEI